MNRRQDNESTLKTVLLISLGWGLLAYVLDVWFRPKKAAEEARREADRLGKPLLNVGAGTPESSLRAKIMGPQIVGDVNVDIAAPKDVPHGPDRVSYADVQALPFKDKQFGVAMTSHVLEHVDDPQKALDELHRVADKVINVTPQWWAPHTWLYQDHQWYITEDQKKAIPLWKKRRDNRAAARRAKRLHNG